MAPKPDDSRPAGGLGEPADRARVLWEHSRKLKSEGDHSGAARYARDALALLDYADDRRRALPDVVSDRAGAAGAPTAPALHSA